MKMYKRLEFFGTESELKDTFTQIRFNVKNNWLNDTISERNFKAHDYYMTNMKDVICVLCMNYENLGEVRVWLLRDDIKAKVSNIIAKHDLFPDEYNSILINFANSVLIPALNKNIKLSISPDIVMIKDLIGTTQEASKAIRTYESFIYNANRSVLHPNDWDLWYMFIVEAFRAKPHSLTSTFLKQLLIEDENWPTDQAIMLSSIYDHGIDILEMNQKLL